MSSYNMKKNTALADFREFIEPVIVRRYPSDRIALYEAWNNWTDSLCKSGLISQKQYDNWSNPYSVSMEAQ